MREPMIDSRMEAWRALEKVEAERDRYREALVPFAFIGRKSMERLGLAVEYDEARKLLGLVAAKR